MRVLSTVNYLPTSRCGTLNRTTESYIYVGGERLTRPRNHLGPTLNVNECL